MKVSSKMNLLGIIALISTNLFGQVKGNWSQDV